MIKSEQKLTKAQAKKLVFILAEKLKVGERNVFESTRKTIYMKSKKAYYFTLSGYAPNGCYFSISIYSFDYVRHTIDYSHNTTGRRYLNALLKAELLKFKKN